MAQGAIQQQSQPDASFVSHPQHNTQATSTSLRFWARSMGDRNPRFVNESYAPGGASRFVAHPCWLYTVNDTAVNAGAPNEVPIIAGTQWEFLRPVVPGDWISTTSRLVVQRQVDSGFAGPALLQTVGIEYFDGREQLVATVLTTLLRVSPERARSKGKYAGWTRWKFTPEQLSGIERDYDREQVRGALPRYHEDVQAGEELPPIVRGPVTSEEMVLFVGATRPIAAIGEFIHGMANGTMAGFIHPRTGTYETYAAGLVDDESARQLGFPAAHDYGIDRISQMASLVANWMGDHGRLVALDARLLEPCMLGDATWFTGTVSGLGPASSRSGRVTLELLGTDQRGQVTVKGNALVELPLRRPVWTSALDTR